MIRTVCSEEVQKGQKCAQAGVISGVWLGFYHGIGTMMSLRGGM